MHDERAAVQRWLAGQRASASLQRTLQATEGPRPARAVVQSLSALSALRVEAAPKKKRKPPAKR